MVQREFDRHHKCTESADIGAVKWVDSSDRILMVAEVPLDSLCAPRGCFAGYLVSLTSREVIQRYSARELMARWKTVVGARLKEDFGRLTVKERDAVP